MPSRTIRPTQAPEPAPFAYTVAAPDGFTPEAVFASWDGSGAGGDFLPCVSYYNADGVLLDRAFPSGATLHSGDTADVSYRPFDRSGGGGAALITEKLLTVVNPTTALKIGAGLLLTNEGGGVARVDSATGPGAALIYAQGEAIGGGWPGNNTPIPFTTLGSLGVTVGPDRWTIQTAGKYVLQAQAVLAVAGPVLNPAVIEAELDFGYIITASTPGSAMWGNRFPLAIPAGQDWSITPSVSQLLTLPVGAVITFQVATNATGTPNFGLGEWSIAKVG